MNISDSVDSALRSLVLLAPANAAVSSIFGRVSHNYSLYRSFQSEMQRLRGRVYLEDEAIKASDLSDDARHIAPTDDDSWHLLTIDKQGNVAGCTRFLRHSPETSFEKLIVRNAALSYCPQWGKPLRKSVEQELKRCRQTGFSYVEFGGWAMDRSIRGTVECLRSVLATYAWSRLIGGVIGISTATERNGSASILQRLGARPLEYNGETLPGYFDPHYDCRMHVLGFDSRKPNPRYENAIRQLQQMLSGILVVSPERPAARRFRPEVVTIPQVMNAPAALVHAA